MKNIWKRSAAGATLLVSFCLVNWTIPAHAVTALDYVAVPPFLTSQAPPLVMLVMGRNHKLYYEAYNDASDLNEDGVLDVGYRGEAEAFVDSNGNNMWDAEPTLIDTNGNGVWDAGEYTDINGNNNWDHESFTDINGDNLWTDGIDYYGYFDSYKCYTYNNTGSQATSLFEPASKTTNKKCTGGAIAPGDWSGDFLNYLTMSRMDALRKVLYGGYRSTDSATDTILQRVYVPQDAHSWGKEYANITVDGYNIADYTPFALPDPGLRHLFASTTLSNNGQPLLRYALNNTHRIWEWVSKEGPVADNSIATSAGGHPGHPGDHNAFESMVNTYAIPAKQFGSGSWLDYTIRNHVDEKYPSPSVADFGAIDGYGNPWGNGYIPHVYNNSDQDNYLAVFTGNVTVATGGNYTIAVDGDDAVEVIIDGGTPNEVVIGYYGAHGRCNCTSHSQVVPLSAGSHSVEFRMEEAGGGDNYYLYWNGPDSGNSWGIIPAAAFTDLTLSTYKLSTPASTIVDLVTRVKVCDPAVGTEPNCKQYPDGDYKPVGLLQRYGETDRMYFGLMSGSYANNTEGGVLRKNISSINDEIDPNTGRFDSTVNGIIKTFNSFRIWGFNYSYYAYRPGWSGAWVTDRPMNAGEFPDWGNPTGEIMYETLRYFAGKGSPTGAFDYTVGSTVDDLLGLPKADWINPYYIEDINGNGVLDFGEDVNGNGQLDGYERCAKPFMLVLSDIYPTFDSDQVPGNIFNAFTGDLTDSAGNNAINADALAVTISAEEGIGGNNFIGQQGTNFDGACTAKTISDLGEIRGLCPEEPTKQGSYTSAAVAYYGAKTDISATADGAQNVSTYSVGLASPLPQMNISIRNKSVTLIPFAKSVGGCLGITPGGPFQPTNTIVDFYVEQITPTSGKFRVNFEDVEQAADHDMDAIALYEYQVNNNGTPSILTDDTLDIKMTATYASGCIIQHLGYIISGTTADGIYLEIRDADTGAGSDVDYFLDTPNTNDDLPLIATRTFIPGSTPGATLLNNPLWYAAKWGGFVDKNTPTEDLNKDGILSITEDTNFNNAIDYTADPVPDLQEEWDKDDDGVPDTYFYVVNPLRLEEQLNKSFAAILNRSSSGTAASVISNSRSGEGAVYQSIFYPMKNDASGNQVAWAGEVQALLVDEHGNMREDHYEPEWYLPANATLPNPGRYQINLKNDLDANGDGDCTDTPGDKDYDGDGQCDKRDLMVLFQGSKVLKFDDVNENQIIDRDEDSDGDRQLDEAEDLNGNGILDAGEDLNGNGQLDASEDLNGNGYLDTDEDANNNGILDTGEDLNNNGELDTYEDANNNGILDTGEDLNNNGVLDIIDETVWGPREVSEALSDTQLKYLWRASDWLNDINTTSIPTGTGSEIASLSDRTNTTSLQDRRIFSFIDRNQNMVVDAGEQKPFVDTDGEFDDYLTLFSPALVLADTPQWVANIAAAGQYPLFKGQQADRVINYIRGADQDLTAEFKVGTQSLPRMRRRQNVDSDGIQKTWRLGDIIHSTPTVVSRPAEGYHLIYKDLSYAAFAARYHKRRTVIYAGGNDGMIHAFNGGFYDADKRTFAQTLKEPYTDISGDGVYQTGEPFIDWNRNGYYDGANQDSFELGAEMWAYVPYNLLPHLYWLTEADYPHVYYNDLKPRIFDARIFPDNATSFPDYPNGWGTVMVVGMRLGGGKITVDTNDDNDGTDANDRTMSSAYVIFDITNPESEPKVLAEISFDNQGYTTSYPTAMPMEYSNGEDWYLIFGSGPADLSGSAAPHPHPSSSDPDILAEAVSKQTGKLYVVDISSLGKPTASPRLQYVDSTGTKQAVPAAGGNYFIEEFDNNSLVSDPIAVDYDLDFNTDALYFGTVIGDESSGWGGKVRRLLPLDDFDTSKWVGKTDITGDGNPDPGGIDRANNTLIDLTNIISLGNKGQPITASVSIGVGVHTQKDLDGDGIKDRNRWIFFGTGRFMTSTDAENIDQQSYYGIKEPWGLNPWDPTTSGFTWGTVDRDNDLLNTSTYNVFDDGIVRDIFGNQITTWNNLLDDMFYNYDGWYINFEEQKERNLGRAALLGELLTFTTYRPSLDACSFEGESWLYPRYFQTGTPYFKSVVGYIHNDRNGNGLVDKGEKLMIGKFHLGTGMALTPNIHTGRQTGSKVFVQTSSGAIKTIDEINPGMTKSGKTSWMKQR